MLAPKIYNVTVEDLAKVDTTLYESQFSSSQLAGMSISQVKECLQGGYDKTVSNAERFISKIESSLELPPTSGFQLVGSPFGARVKMGDWLAGSPMPCRRRVKRESDIAPIKIVVGNFVSYGISATDYQRRSEAVIALLLIVQRYRPIDLIVSLESMTEDCETPIYGLLQLESRPISLSQAGFIVGHPAFSRIWGFSWLKAQGAGENIPNPQQSIDQKLNHIGLNETDLYIDSVVLGDPLISNPEQWIKDQLDRYIGGLQ